MRHHVSLELMHSHDMTEKEEQAMRFTVVLSMSKCSSVKSPEDLIASPSVPLSRIMFVL